MEQVSELRDSLNAYFQWNKARITVFAQMLLALIVMRTVNLNKISRDDSPSGMFDNAVIYWNFLPEIA